MEIEQDWAEKEPGLPEDVMTEMKAGGQRDEGGDRRWKIRKGIGDAGNSMGCPGSLKRAREESMG